jgi:hypothetical protein
MAVPAAQVAEEIVERLSREGVNELLERLWPVDCQGCGRPLGEQAPALVVEEVGPFATAGLFHDHCKTSGWNDTGAVRVGRTATTSFTVMAVLLPLQVAGSEPVLTPTLIINPGLEHVFLRPVAGRWVIDLPAAFADAGMRSPGPEFRLTQPIPGAVVRVGVDDVAVTLDDGPHTTYTSAINDQFRAEVLSHGGLLLIVTHAVNPATVQTLPELQPVLRGVDSLFGWVEVAARREGRARPPRPATGQTYLLHYSPRILAVGPLLAQTSDQLSNTKAKAWATKFLQRQKSRMALIDWAPFLDGTGFYTVDALSVRQFAVRRYPDGWRLAQMLSRHDSPSAETENEARAWASQVLRAKAQVTAAMDWQPGPTPDGAVTLYADA